MKRLTLLFIIILIINSCKSGVRKNVPINFLIKEGQSYTWNMEDGMYTIFFMNKPSIKIKFFLTEKEKMEIIEAYYSLELDDLENDLEMKDECNEMPKIYTFLTVERKGNPVQIKIDEYCNDFYLSDYQTAKRIKTFLSLIKKIINQKSEVKDAPNTDIMAM